MEPDAQVLALCIRDLIVAKKIYRAIVRSEQKIDVAVTIEVSVGKTATDFRLAEIGANFLGHVAKRSLALIKKQLRRLSVSNVPANVPHSFINVAIRDREVERTIEIEIREHTAEAEHVLGR